MTITVCDKCESKKDVQLITVKIRVETNGEKLFNAEFCLICREGLQELISTEMNILKNLPEKIIVNHKLLGIPPK